MSKVVFGMSQSIKDAAHGGAGWTPRITSLREEIGKIWGECGMATEWAHLEVVLLHRPGPEIETIANANDALMLAIPDTALAAQ
jgi:hypothetical protein